MYSLAPNNSRVLVRPSAFSGSFLSDGDTTADLFLETEGSFFFSKSSDVSFFDSSPEDAEFSSPITETKQIIFY